MDTFELKTLAKRLAALVAREDAEAFHRLEREYLASTSASEDGRQLVVSYRALLELELLAREAELEEHHRPRMWWMRGPYPGNFGDVLTPYVFWHGFGVAPRWTDVRHAEGISIGSIAKFARPGMKVWGAGMPRDSDPVVADAVWASVRGPLSRSAVVKAGGAVPEIFGDPAVLLPELYDPVAEKAADVGIIAHVLQEDGIRACLHACEAGHTVKLISLRAGPFDQIERVIRDIKSCREIVSTSLHGAIVAHAYGVPCQSARVAWNGEVSDSFKMRDYKTSVGLADRPIAIPPEFSDLAWLDKRACVLPPNPIDTALLRSTFPFPYRINAKRPMASPL